MVVTNQQVIASAPITPIEIDLYAPFEPTTFFRIFRHASVQVNGIKLHYVIGGQGEPVVLLNGFPETWYAWRKIMPVLATHHTVIAVDVRGTGASDKPTHGYDARTIASDIYQLVQQLNVGSIHLGGAAAEKPIPNYSLVGIPAAGQLMMAKVLMEEMKDSGVRINELVINSYVSTRSSIDHAKPEWVTVEEIGDYVAWIASDEAYMARSSVLHLEQQFRG